MKFSVQTLVALSTAVAIVMGTVRSGDVGVAVMCYVMPICMMIIAITSPKRGQQLDPTGRWYLFLLAKTWFYAALAFVLFGMVCVLSPYWEDRMFRAMDGDTRAYQIRISFEADREMYESQVGRRLKLYDKDGLVGEVRDLGFWESRYVGMGKWTKDQVWLKVSTDRRDSRARNRMKFDVEVCDNGSLYIVDPQ